MNGRKDPNEDVNWPAYIPKVTDAREFAVKVLNLLQVRQDNRNLSHTVSTFEDVAHLFNI